ncbi:MAG TPA: ABC transporter permease [Candidatus Angelobacter sp.]|jgi:ABC-2 type transport system permease protein|nr:ABC transporter permease [Candidatus Angelobacter sp.]
MTFTRTSAIVLRQFYLVRGSVSRLVPMFVWVGVDMVLWGFITRWLNTVSGSGFNFVPAMLGAVLLWDFFIRVMQGITMAFFEDVWSRNFLNFFASPLLISEYLGGLVLSSIATSSVGLTVMLLLATGVFGLSFFVYGALLAPYIMVLFMVGIALGIFAVAMVLRLGPASEWFIWPIPAVLSPFAGVFYPLATLPVWMRAIARLLPPSYVFESMRAILAGKPAHVSSLLIGASLAVLYILLACWFFQGTYRHAVRTGLIARYSAETAS